MNFLIADTFTDSLTRLTGDEQKAVKTTAFDLQMNPAQPGMKFHKLDKAKDRRFHSVRINDDIRLILHKAESSLLLCYVDHHDAAYRWAERRKLETHPTTGAAQLVEVRETVREVVVPKYVEVDQPGPKKKILFSHLPDEQLLGYGVPQEWLEEVKAADEDSLLELAESLPAEAAEALLNLAVGVKPPVQQPVPAGTDPFAHPDAQRRFRIMNNIEELERALEYPWDKWTIFLHPAQRQLVEKDYNGPARVAGSAGTGKSIVSLHRAVHLARVNPDTRVLLTTFSTPLANALGTKLRRLISNEPRLGERLEVLALPEISRRLYERNVGPLKLVEKQHVMRMLSDAAGEGEKNSFSKNFLFSEWDEVVDAWQLETWEAYRDVKRLGRKTRLPEPQRKVLWSIFDKVRTELASKGLETPAGMLYKLTERLKASNHPPFDHIVVDEAQDISVPQLRFLAAVAGDRPNGLFFAGDSGQRIFQQPFSWLALGVDIRGRSKSLHINYRTSHQIRSQADKLLGPEVSDVDGNIESRRGTQSVFNGPPPRVVTHTTPEEESEAVAHWMTERQGEGMPGHEIGVFVRSDAEIERATAAAKQAGMSFVVLDEHLEGKNGHVNIGTMHLAKGLEFRAVAVMACDDEVIPLQSRIEAVADDADLKEVYETERHLLYVACTRARDHLLITGGGEHSEFLDDLRASTERGVNSAIS